VVRAAAHLHNPHGRLRAWGRAQSVAEADVNTTMQLWALGAKPAAATLKDDDVPERVEMAPNTTVEIAALMPPPMDTRARVDAVDATAEMAVVREIPRAIELSVDVADMGTVELPREQAPAPHPRIARAAMVREHPPRTTETASEGPTRALAALATGNVLAALASAPKPKSVAKQTASEESTAMLVAIGTQRDPTDANRRLVVMAPHEKDRQAIVDGWWVLEGDGVAKQLVNASGASAARIQARAIVGDKSFSLRAAREQDLATLAVL
jgi:hypothetical protein